MKPPARIRNSTSRRPRPTAALPPTTPKAAKRTTGRVASVAQIPAFIRSDGARLSKEDRQLLRQKLATRLAKFAPKIERVSVRVSDVNGPRGGIDQACRVKVVLKGLPSIIVDDRNASPHAAIDAALTSAVRAVRKALQRRQTKPLRANRA